MHPTRIFVACLGLVAVAWSLTLGAEWALLALPTHLCADRGLLGNGFKAPEVPFARAQGALA